MIYIIGILTTRPNENSIRWVFVCGLRGATNGHYDTAIAVPRYDKRYGTIVYAKAFERSILAAYLIE